MNCWWQSKISKFFTHYDFNSPKDQLIIKKFYNIFDFNSLLLLKEYPDINVDSVDYSLKEIPFYHFLLLSHWHFASHIQDYVSEFKQIINAKNSLGETSLHVLLKACLNRVGGKKEMLMANTIIDNSEINPNDFVNNNNCFSIINKNKNIMSYQLGINLKNLTLTDSLTFHDKILEKINKKTLFLDLQKELVVNKNKIKTKI